MAERISALHGHYAPGRIGAPGETGVVLREVRGLILHQISAWPDTLARVGEKAARAAGVESAPGPNTAREQRNPARPAGEMDSAPDPDATASAIDRTAITALLRVDPLKWWILNAKAPQITAEQGTILDLSDARTHLRISGRRAANLLNRHLPLDLRPASFPEGAVASSALHHVGVTLWHSQYGYELFIPRGFALSLWEVLLQTAAQFGAEIV